MEPECSLPQSQVPATCPYPDPDQYSPCRRPTSWRSILIFCSHRRLGFPSGLFPSGFHTVSLFIPLHSPVHAKCFAHLILLGLITPTTFVEQYSSLSSSLCTFSPFPCKLVPLRPKYSSQHPVLKHPYPTFLPQFWRPLFTPIHIHMAELIFS